MHLLVAFSMLVPKDLCSSILILPVLTCHIYLTSPLTRLTICLIRFAWSEPFSLPAWVEKRLTPLSKHHIPHTTADKLFGQQPIDDTLLSPSSDKKE